MLGNERDSIWTTGETPQGACAASVTDSIMMVQAIPKSTLTLLFCVKPDGCGPVMTVTLIEVVSRFLNLYSKSLCIIQVSRDSGNTYPVFIRKSSSFVIGLLNSS